MDINQKTPAPTLRNEPEKVIPPTKSPPCSEARQWQGLKVYHPELDAAIRAVVRWYQQGYDATIDRYTEGGAIILAGGYGCGKTTLAQIAYHHSGGPVIVTDWGSGKPEAIHNAVFCNEPDLLEEIRQSYRDGGESKLVARLQKCRLLILDDIGAAYVKEESQRWYEDIMWRIFDNRKDKKTLMTTNLNPVELRTRLGGRCWSRVQEMLGRPDNFVSMFSVPDYRAQGF